MSSRSEILHGVMLRCVIKGRSKDDSTAGARVLQSSPRKTLSAVVLIPTRIFAMSPKRFHDFSSTDCSQWSVRGSESLQGVFVSAGTLSVPTLTSYDLLLCDAMHLLVASRASNRGRPLELNGTGASYALTNLGALLIVSDLLAMIMAGSTAALNSFVSPRS